jgi:hypothetical protein
MICEWKFEKNIFVIKKYTLSYAKTSIKTISYLPQLLLKQINDGLNIALRELDKHCFTYIILICCRKILVEPVLE